MPLPPNMKVREIDRLEVTETFADCVSLGTFDGHNVRLTFCIHRYDEVKPPAPPSAAKLPACRLVLSPDGVVELYNTLQGLMPAMTESGFIKQNPAMPDSGPVSRH